MELLRRELTLLTASLSRVLDDHSQSVEPIESFLVCADRVQHLLAALVDSVAGIERNLPLIESIIRCLESISAIRASMSSAAFSAARFYSGERGRPRAIVSREMVDHLISNRFSVRQAAQLLQVSGSTLRRHMHEFGITVRSTYSTMNDSQLDCIISQVQSQYPNS